MMSNHINNSIIIPLIPPNLNSIPHIQVPNTRIYSIDDITRFNRAFVTSFKSNTPKIAPLLHCRFCSNNGGNFSVPTVASADGRPNNHANHAHLFMAHLGTHLFSFNGNFNASSPAYHLASLNSQSMKRLYCFTHKCFSKKNKPFCSHANQNSNICYLTALSPDALSCAPCIPVPGETTFLPPRPLVPVDPFPANINQVVYPSLTENEIATTFIPTIKKVPHQVIPNILANLTKLLVNATNSNDPSSQIDLLSFAKCVLVRPKSGTSNRAKIAIILSNLDTFSKSSADAALLFRSNADQFNQTNIDDNLQNDPPFIVKSNTDEHGKLNPNTIKTALYHSQNGSFSKAVGIIDASPVAPPSTAVSNMLDVLLASTASSVLRSPPPINTINDQWTDDINIDKIIDYALRNPSITKGGGWDGLAPYLLKQLLISKSSTRLDDFKKALVLYFEKMLNGTNIPDATSASFMSLRLFALLKNPLSATSYLDMLLRPISDGNSWRKLICAYYAHELLADCKHLISSNQLGLSSGGIEHIIHIIRILMLHLYPDANIRSNPLNPKVHASVDLKNAFTTLDLNIIHNALIDVKNGKHVQYFKNSYDKGHLYWYYNKAKQSFNGLGQGLNESGILFCIGLNTIISKFNILFPSLDLNAWFFDDCNLIGDLDTVFEAFTWLIVNLATIGLLVNLNKCHIGWVSESPLINDEYNRLLTEKFTMLASNDNNGIYSKEGIVILGSLIASSPENEMSISFFSKMFTKINNTLSKVQQLQDPQSFANIQRQCLSIGKVMLLLRTIPVIPNLFQLENITKNQFDENLHISTSIQQFQDQIQFPIRYRGFGLTSPYTINPIAYLASLIASNKQISRLAPQISPDFLRSDVIDNIYPHDSDTLTLLNETPKNKSQDPLEATTYMTLHDELGSPSPKLQYKLLDNYFNIKHKQLKQRLQADIDKVQFNTHSGKGASSFLSVTPSYGRGTIFDPDDFRALAWLRIGQHLFSDGEKCNQPKCNSFVNSLGHHTLHCKFGSQSLSGRHSACRNSFFKIAKHAGLTVVEEDTNIIIGQRIDLSILRFDEGRMALADVTISNGYANYLQPFAARSLDALIAKIRVMKLDSAPGQRFATVPNADFVPLPFDAFANTDMEGIKFIKHLTTHHIRRSGYDFASGFKFNIDYIRCGILRYSARMLNVRLASLNLISE